MERVRCRVSAAVDSLAALDQFWAAASPSGDLQPKTILLYQWIRVAAALFAFPGIAWLLLPQRWRMAVVAWLRQLANWRWMLLAILAVATAVRVSWLLYFPTQPYADSEWYYRTAAQLAAGHGYVWDLESRQPLVGWPIGYPALLAIFFVVTGPSTVLAQSLNVLFSVVCVALTFAIGDRLFGRMVATVAGLVLALFPGMVVYASLVSTDLLFMLLTTATYFMVLRPIAQRQRAANAIDGLLAGLLVGISTLVRATGMTLLPLWGLVRWMVTGSFMRALGWTLAGVVAVALVVLPWTIRNYVHFQKIIPVSTNGGVNFWIGNNPWARGDFMWPRDEAYNPLLPLMGNEPTINAEGYHLGLEYLQQMAREDPAHLARLYFNKALYMFNAFDFGLGWNKLSAVIPDHPGVGDKAFAVTDLVYWLGAGFALFGLLALVIQSRAHAQISGAAYSWRPIGLLFTCPFSARIASCCRCCRSMPSMQPWASWHFWAGQPPWQKLWKRQQSGQDSHPRAFCGWS